MPREEISVVTRTVVLGRVRLLGGSAEGLVAGRRARSAGEIAAVDIGAGRAG